MENVSASVTIATQLARNNRGRFTGGPADMLDEMMTVAWKYTGVCVILNDAFLVRLESGAAS